MLFISWDNVYKTGIEIIDYQHKRLVQILNDLYDVHEKEDLRTDLISMFLDELILYTKYHFEKEEDIMSEIKYDLLADHHNTHQKFVKTILLFQERVTRGDNVVPDLLKYLKDWLVGHIEVEDKKYVNYIMTSPGVV